MLWTLLAIAVTGLGAAGIALLLRKLTRNKLPKWIVPLFGGLGMLGYQIFYEYSWFEHQLQRQPFPSTAPRHGRQRRSSPSCSSSTSSKSSVTQAPHLG